MAGSPVAPSVPQFHDALSCAPSWLSSPFAQLLLRRVAHHVGQGEAVVGGDEVDARLRAPPAGRVEVGRAGEASAEVGGLAGVAAPEAAHGIAEAVVPLRPAAREAPGLIAALAEVPRLGDQLDRGEHRVARDRVEEARARRRPLASPHQRGGEVEAEAVDVHLEHPVAQAVEHELEHARVPEVERVAAAGQVEVLAPVLRTQAVVGAVVDAAEGQRGPAVRALGGVVVDHVEEHLDAGAVERPHHRLELVGRALGRGARGQADVRREVAERVVAPVVGQAARDDRALAHPPVHGQELHRGHAEPAQVVEHRRRGEAGVRAAELGRHVGMARGEALDVRLVDHGPVPGCPRRAIALPVERRIDHHARGHVGRAVAGIGHAAVGVVGAVAEDRVVPVDLAGEAARVGVHEELRRVEPVALPRRVGAVHAVAVARAGPGAGDAAVPDVAGAAGEPDPLALARGLAVRAVEQAEVDRGGVLAEEPEVGAIPVAGDAERRRVGLRGDGRRAHVAWRKSTTPSGGRVRRSEHGWPCAGTGSAHTPPPLPTSLPP